MGLPESHQGEVEVSAVSLALELWVGVVFAEPDLDAVAEDQFLGFASGAFDADAAGDLFGWEVAGFVEGGEVAAHAGESTTACCHGSRREMCRKAQEIRMAERHLPCGWSCAARAWIPSASPYPGLNRPPFLVPPSSPPLRVGGAALSRGAATSTTPSATSAPRLQALRRGLPTALRKRSAISARMSQGTATQTAAAGGVTLTGLAKSFRGPEGPVHAVRGIDVSIAAGETVALLGPNGAGKSTTIDMMLGLLEPDHGPGHGLRAHPGARPSRTAPSARCCRPAP